jgi:hypothetical protein
MYLRGERELAVADDRAVGIATYLHVVKAGFFQPGMWARHICAYRLIAEIQSASDFAKLIGTS